MKLDGVREKRHTGEVAPRAGAWIETHVPDEASCVNGESPPARGRGVKLAELMDFERRPERRPPCGGVD